MRHRLLKAMTTMATTLCVANATAGYVDAAGPVEEYASVYAQILATFGGKCPPEITIKTGELAGISQFNPNDASVLISRTTPAARRTATIAHETVHLCMNRMSRGASTTPKYRFIDEGFAKFYGDGLLLGEEAVRRTALAKSGAFLRAGQVDFAQAMDWPRYFGDKGKGGLLGFDAYYVGTSFYLYVRDTYGAERFFRLVEEIGSSLSFNRALQAALGKGEEEVEQEWLAYIRTHMPQ